MVTWGGEARTEGEAGSGSLTTSDEHLEKEPWRWDTLALLTTLDDDDACGELCVPDPPPSRGLADEWGECGEPYGEPCDEPYGEPCDYEFYDEDAAVVPTSPSA